MWHTTSFSNSALKLHLWIICLFVCFKFPLSGSHSWCSVLLTESSGAAKWSRICQSCLSLHCTNSKKMWICRNTFTKITRTSTFRVKRDILSMEIHWEEVKRPVMEMSSNSMRSTSTTADLLLSKSMRNSIYKISRLQYFHSLPSLPHLLTASVCDSQAEIHPSHPQLPTHRNWPSLGYIV